MNVFVPEAAARLGHFDFAEKEARAVLEDMRASGLVPGSAWALFDLGLALGGSGQEAEALDAFQGALSLFRDFDWPWETGNTLVEMARVLIDRDGPDDRRAAQAYLQEAFNLFDSISAQPMRERTEALLAAL